MFEYPKYNQSKALNAALYLLNLIPQNQNSMDKIKLMKLLYYSDQLHLVKYGRFITNGIYKKFDYGPVPSKLYIDLKSNIGIIQENKNSYYTDINADLDLLSQSEIECLNEIFSKYASINTFDLAELSHDIAWKNAKLGKSLSIRDIISEVIDDQNEIQEILDYYSERNNIELMFN